MNDIQLILPVLHIVKEISPSYTVCYWDKEVKIKDKLITWYSGGGSNRDYSSNTALDANITLDIWSSSVAEISEITLELIKVLDMYCRSYEIDGLKYVLKVNSVGWRDLEKDTHTNLNRRNITINVVIVIF